MVTALDTPSWCVQVPEMPNVPNHLHAIVITSSIFATRLNCTLQDACDELERLSLWRVVRKGRAL